jgi:hypothetical protein
MSRLNSSSITADQLEVPRFTKYSREAKAKLPDAYVTLRPAGLQLPPRFEIRQPVITIDAIFNSFQHCLGFVSPG